MTDTAYSKALQKEVDPEQYVALLGLDDSTVHAFAREDVVCPICETGGGSYVRASVNGAYRKKAHFRFAGDDDISAHHPSCDFYGDRLSNEVSQHLVSFTTERTKITHVIRKMVCAGIQENIFTQEAMRNMRQWFFAKRCESAFEIVLSEEQIDWLAYIVELPVYPYAWPREEIIPFHPMQAIVPGFDWGKAIARETVRLHQKTLKRLEELNLHRKHIVELQSYVSKTKHATLLDPELLKEEYAKTLQLNSFIINNYIEFQNKSVKDRANGEEKLLAFSALLLFVADWDIDEAIAKFSVIANVRHVEDLLAGNFMGLNPYFKFSIANTAKTLQDNWPIDYRELEEWQVEQSMREAYVEHSLKLATPLPQLKPDLYVTKHLEFERREAESERWIASVLSNS
ncbi:hypothetical protein ABME00_25545 [Citrobacter amalonaticus]|uniref:hypothetical protein n=1 Tax=Enterobacter hormaechei TaxID=158836 RepID=UPI002810C449|nr:hypothetical protein [Enterobacter hormaechei]WMQ89873.1 hypothetical protein RCR42_26805 [Enterobacter hormaechei]HCB4671695.1 hypothetical protein [Enterobacter cloacae]